MHDWIQGRMYNNTLPPPAILIGNGKSASIVAVELLPTTWVDKVKEELKLTN